MKTSGVVGLSRNSSAPSESASRSSSGSVKVAVQTMKGTRQSCSSAFQRRRSVKPSITGITRSEMTRSGRDRRASTSASAPLPAELTVHPWASSSGCSVDGEASSTIRTRFKPPGALNRDSGGSSLLGRSACDSGIELLCLNVATSGAAMEHVTQMSRGCLLGWAGVRQPVNACTAELSVTESANVSSWPGTCLRKAMASPRSLNTLLG